MQTGSSKPGKPGLMVRLTPAGPWRIGPDSGARNHVDSVYHSDSLYGAVSSAMDRLGVFAEWLEATARRGAAEVAFSSCFPFVDEVNLVVPPRTLWPPSSPALLASRVRWKSARFVPLSLIPSLVARTRLADSEWSVDGASQCLLPAGKLGPFRSGLRFRAAVDRLTGIGERHSVACLEFRPGAGLWTLVSFAGEAACDRWSSLVKAAFRLLADSGFGGERSQGWGHAAPPEFTEGWLPEMILPPRQPAAAPVEPVPSVEPAADVVDAAALPSRDREGAVADPSALADIEPAPAASTESALPEPSAPADVEPAPAEATESALPEPSALADVEPALAASTESALPEPSAPADIEPAPAEATESALPEPSAPADIEPAPAASTESALPEPSAPADIEPAPAASAESALPEPSALADVEPAPAEATAFPSRDREGAVADQFAPLDVEPGQSAPPAPEPTPVEPTEPATPESTPTEAAVRQPPEIAPLFAPAPEAPAHPAAAHWMLSLFTPAPSDQVDWTRGNYTLVTRAGRVADSGELKKTAQMIAEGSVLYAVSAPSGNALDVAPDGFTHPVFRAGFAVSVPLPEVG